MKSKCSFCNKEFEGDLNFCPHCGKPIAKENKLSHFQNVAFHIKVILVFAQNVALLRNKLKKL